MAMACPPPELHGSLRRLILKPRLNSRTLAGLFWHCGPCDGLAPTAPPRATEE
eukprot:CAMPEP_0179024202 /NCGR_PEP_ID=MMETSP0796-20121207/7334_1 /TAXON_ID=73915 /ORGANISM="Pyrodinium bahamense, Strain pbaha01" /LENGTH=52 /DNA_ID=CAMNT_0020720157 /DNA_START=176 /DNA_END=331 /DNA_ORIENTATION=+